MVSFVRGNNLFVVDTATELGESERTAGAGSAVDLPARGMLVLSTPHRDETARA